MLQNCERGCTNFLKEMERVAAANRPLQPWQAAGIHGWRQERRKSIKIAAATAEGYPGRGANDCVTNKTSQRRVTTPEFSSANGKLLTGVSASNSLSAGSQPRGAPGHLTAVIPVVPVDDEGKEVSMRWPDRTACCAVVRHCRLGHCRRRALLASFCRRGFPSVR